MAADTGRMVPSARSSAHTAAQSLRDARLKRMRGLVSGGHGRNLMSGNDDSRLIPLKSLDSNVSISKRGYRVNTVVSAARSDQRFQNNQTAAEFV